MSALKLALLPSEIQLSWFLGREKEGVLRRILVMVCLVLAASSGNCAECGTEAVLVTLSQGQHEMKNEIYLPMHTANVLSRRFDTI